MKRKCFVVFRHFHKNFSEIFRIFSRSAGIPFLSLPFCIRACRKVPVCRSAEKCGFLRLLCEFSLIPMQNMIYLGCILPTPNAPGQRVFSRCAAPFSLEIRQYSCEKMSCSTQKFLAAGHIGSFQIHPKRYAAVIPVGCKQVAFADIHCHFLSGSSERKRLHGAYIR